MVKTRSKKISNKRSKRSRIRSKRRTKRGGSKQSNTLSQISNENYENTQKQHEAQNNMNNQFGGGNSDEYASVVAGGDNAVVGSQLNIQNTLKQAEYEDGLSHCADGSCQSGKGKRRKSRRKSKENKMVKNKMVKNKTKKVRKKKRKLNKFFVLMLAAKKKGLASFKYNGKTYVGKKDKRLGMIYKKK